MQKRKIRRKILENLESFREFIKTVKFEGKLTHFCEINRNSKSVLISLSSVIQEIIMHTKEFALIERRMFMSKQPVKETKLLTTVYRVIIQQS